MSTVAEIEAAIEKLRPAEVEELARWLQERRARGTTRPPVDEWLAHARGAARPGVTTDELLAATRGDG
jgi:hypothetical protein